MIAYTFQMKLLIFHVKKHVGEVCIPNIVFFFKYYNLHTKFMILMFF
jgi:hypothetical protein